MAMSKTRLLIIGIILAIVYTFVSEIIDYKLTVGGKNLIAQRQADFIVNMIDGSRDPKVPSRLFEGSKLEEDPWDNPFRVSYARGAFAERVEVRSSGQDCIFNTYDDIVSYGQAMPTK